MGLRARAPAFGARLVPWDHYLMGGGWQAMRRNRCSENKFGGWSWDQTDSPRGMSSCGLSHLWGEKNRCQQ